MIETKFILNPPQFRNTDSDSLAGQQTIMYVSMYCTNCQKLSCLQACLLCVVVFHINHMVTRFTWRLPALNSSTVIFIIHPVRHPFVKVNCIMREFHIKLRVVQFNEAKMTSFSDPSSFVKSFARLLSIHFWMSSRVTLLTLCESSWDLVLFSSFIFFILGNFVHSLISTFEQKVGQTLVLSK